MTRCEYAADQILISIEREISHTCNDCPPAVLVALRACRRDIEVVIHQELLALKHDVRTEIFDQEERL
jgi:hypothetical protein